MGRSKQTRKYPPPIHEQSKWPLRRLNPRERFVHEVKIINVTPRKLQEFLLDTAAYANIQKEIKPPLTDYILQYA